MPSRQAHYIRARVRDLFPPDDPLVPPLLRLMAAVDDLRTLQKLWFWAYSRVGNSESEQAIITAESTYLFRLTCATVYESALAFQDLEAPAQGIIEKIPEKGQAAFLALSNIFASNFVDSTRHGKVLVQLRNVVFHYDRPRAFRTELLLHDEMGNLVLGDVQGASRYLLADDLQIQILHRRLGGSFEAEMRELMRVVTGAAGYFGELIDSIVYFYLDSNNKAIEEWRNESVDMERLWNITPGGTERGPENG